MNFKPKKWWRILTANVEYSVGAVDESGKERQSDCSPVFALLFAVGAGVVVNDRPDRNPDVENERNKVIHLEVESSLNAGSRYEQGDQDESAVCVEEERCQLHPFGGIAEQVVRQREEHNAQSNLHDGQQAIPRGDLVDMHLAKSLVVPGVVVAKKLKPFQIQAGRTHSYCSHSSTSAPTPLEAFGRSFRVAKLYTQSP